MAARSRGPPRPAVRRARARSMSGAPRRPSWTARRKAPSSASSPTASCRARSASTSPMGAARRDSSRRPPAAVTVRSMAWRSEPSRVPASERATSRLRRVAASICTRAPAASRTGGLRRGSAPFWVMSSQSATAPIAASSGRVKAPNPSSVAAPKSAATRAAACALSKLAGERGVGTAPASSTMGRSSASSASGTITSRGARRASSGASRARGAARTRNAPVEMSTQASAPAPRISAHAAR